MPQPMMSHYVPHACMSVASMTIQATMSKQPGAGKLVCTFNLLHISAMTRCNKIVARTWALQDGPNQQHSGLVSCELHNEASNCGFTLIRCCSDPTGPRGQSSASIGTLAWTWNHYRRQLASPSPCTHRSCCKHVACMNTSPYCLQF